MGAYAYAVAGISLILFDAIFLPNSQCLRLMNIFEKNQNEEEKKTQKLLPTHPQHSTRCVGSSHSNYHYVARRMAPSHDRIVAGHFNGAHRRLDVFTLNALKNRSISSSSPRSALVQHISDYTMIKVKQKEKIISE